MATYNASSMTFSFPATINMAIPTPKMFVFDKGFTCNGEHYTMMGFKSWVGTENNQFSFGRSAVDRVIVSESLTSFFTIPEQYRKITFDGGQTLDFEDFTNYFVNLGAEYEKQPIKILFSSIASAIKQVGGITENFNAIEFQQKILGLSKPDRLQGFWKINDTVTINSTMTWSVNFASVSFPPYVTSPYTSFKIEKGTSHNYIRFDNYAALTDSAWTAAEAKMIYISSKYGEVANALSLLQWLHANGVKLA